MTVFNIPSSSATRPPSILGFWGPCPLPRLGTYQVRITETKQNRRAWRPPSPPQGPLSPLPPLMVLSEPRGGSARLGAGGGRQRGVRTREGPPSGARFCLSGGPLFYTTHPVRKTSWGWLASGGWKSTKEKLQEQNWHGAAGPASVHPGVDATLGALHVLSRQLRGHLRGQAVGQGSGGRSHMLLKAVDARLFGGLGAG